MGDPVITTSGGGSNPGPVVDGGANPHPPLAPVTVNSEHCLDASIADLDSFRRSLTAAPCDSILTGLLPQITDSGNIEIQLAGPMNAGTYRGGVVVSPNGWMEARLSVVNGRISGTIDFFPPLTKRGGIVGVGDATISQLQINTDANGNITFGATATFLNLNLPMTLFGRDVSPMNVTEELTETLFGRRMSSIPGPASRFLQSFFQAQANPNGRLENLVNMAGVRFRIVANPREGDPLVPDIGPVSNAHIRLPELRLSPTVTLSDVDLNLEMHYNEETGGFRVVIPRASIGTIRHAPTVACNGAPNPGSEIRNVRLEDITLNLDPRGDRDQLGNDTFRAASLALSTLAGVCSGQPGDLTALLRESPMFPASGSGRILMDSGSIQGGDIRLHPLTGDHAISFNLTGERAPLGEAPGAVHVTLDAPEIGVDHAGVMIGGELLLNQTANVGVENALLRNLHATLDLQNGEMSYNASFTPDLASATLRQTNAEGNLLISAALMGFTSSPITASGEHVGTDREIHRIHVENAALTPSQAQFFNPLPARGTARFGFSGLGLDASFTRSGMHIDRMVLPEYNVGADVDVSGGHINASIRNGNATTRLLAGLGLVADTADSRGHVSGVTHTASVNTRVERVRFTAMGGRTFEMTGTLTGSMGLLDKHTEVPGTFVPPDFRPTVGGMSLSLNGTVREIGGSHLTLSGSSIRISDDARGHIAIAGNTTVNVEGETITAAARIAADLHRHVHDFPYTRPGAEASAVRYYDFDPNTDLNIPLSQILVEAAMPGVGTLRAIGSGRISGRIANPLVNATLPFGEQHLTINRPGLPVTGTVDLTGGGLDVNGGARGITVNVRPPESVHVNFTQERDGVTYTYAGDLRSTSSFRATIDPRTGRVRFNGGGTTPQLTGDLTVTATTMRDGNRVTLGSGTAHVSTTYSISGTADSSGAHIALTVPETGLSGSLTSPITIGPNTIPAGTAFNVPIRNFSGNIDLNTATGGFTSRWTAGDIGPARVTIPSIALPGGINFNNVTAEFSAVANGQQWEVARNGAGRVTFRALPGPDGNLPPFQVNFGARDGDGSALNLTLTSSSSARDISGSADPSEMVFDVTGMTLGSRLGGSLTVAGRPIDLSSGLLTDANMPRIQVRINPTTGAMRLVATPPTPPTVTAPPTDLTEWMAWTTDQWRTYQTQMNTSDPAHNVGHMVTMSEQALSMPLMDAFLPPGRGRVYIDMDPIDLSIPAGAADGPQRILAALQAGLHMSREFPNPPPRSGSGEPIVWNDAQRPLYRPDGAPGTLFFIREARTGGDPRLDPDMAGNLELLLGTNSDETARIIRSGRLEMSDLVAAVRRDPNVASAISEDTLTALATSYLNDSGGSFRRFSQRMAIALGTIRANLPALSAARGGYLPVHTHEFADPSYHVAPSGNNDGADMEFMAVLPIAPSAAARVLTTSPSGAWDPWVTESTLTGATDTGTLLGDHRFSLTQASSTDGNITVLRMTPGSGGAMVADTRTVRLVPLSNGRTLMIMDQHEDYPNSDIDIRLPRIRVPERPALSMETFGTNALTLINSRAPDMYAYYANRFAVMAGRITASANGTDVNALAYDSREPFSAVSRSSRIVEYLTLDTTDAANPALRIGADASAAAITADFTSHLGVSSAVASRWITAGRIPLSELLTETGLNTTFSVPVFQAAVTTLLNPPAAAVPTMRHFSSPTERLLIMVEDLRRTTYLRTPVGGAYNTITRDFNHPRFHTTSTEQTNDTVDTFMYWYVPNSLGITSDNVTWFVHHADQFPTYDSNFASSSVVDRSTIPGADPNRTYIDTGINVDMLGAFNYRISLPNDPIPMTGGVLLSPWVQERSSTRDFLINNGWWLALPTTDGNGYVVIRAGVINTRLPADRDPTAASTAQGRVIGFMPNVLRGAAAHQGGGVPTGTIPTYNSTPSILYNQHAP